MAAERGSVVPLPRFPPRLSPPSPSSSSDDDASLPFLRSDALPRDEPDASLAFEENDTDEKDKDEKEDGAEYDEEREEDKEDALLLPGRRRDVGRRHGLRAEEIGP